MNENQKHLDKVSMQSNVKKMKNHHRKQQSQQMSRYHPKGNAWHAIQQPYCCIKWYLFLHRRKCEHRIALMIIHEENPHSFHRITMIDAIVFVVVVVLHRTTPLEPQIAATTIKNPTPIISQCHAVTHNVILLTNRSSVEASAKALTQTIFQAVSMSHNRACSNYARSET